MYSVFMLIWLEVGFGNIVESFSLGCLNNSLSILMILPSGLLSNTGFWLAK